MARPLGGVPPQTMVVVSLPFMYSSYAGMVPPVSGWSQDRSRVNRSPSLPTSVRSPVGAVLAGAPGADAVVRSRVLLSAEDLSEASRARTVKV
ncbi:hypothetical protein GA0115255_1271114 [Streptomyces sp. Ncost-T6T-2b]|nr:hypothetical protein GA0115255_1271114 [Streptomyces sp. Ncost-T6T-2b]